MLPVGESFTFRTPYDQYRERDGQEAVVVRHYTENDDDHDITEVGPMYLIRFTGGEEIEAWPEEVETGATGGMNEYLRKHVHKGREVVEAVRDGVIVDMQDAENVSVTNEAAERLRLFVYANANRDGMNDEAGWMKDIDEALAAERRVAVEQERKRITDVNLPAIQQAERRATVERLRPVLIGLLNGRTEAERLLRIEVGQALDEEAAR
jgi:hypothetical protein